jgi:perosamine synthetase
MDIEFPKYPACNDAVIKAVTDQLRSGQWVRLEGAPELESAWERHQGGGHAWFVSSGTAALQALFLGHGIGPGDAVITTPYSWGASVSAILAIGAVPVFADIDYRTGQIDAQSVGERITGRTRAILAVHLFGIPAPVRELAELARDRGLLLFEDASQAHGAVLHGRRVGGFGDGAAFSCMGLKPLGATEGGLAVFRDAAARERAYLYGRHPRGIAPERVAWLQEQGLLDTLQLGWRPSAVSAAILMARLPDLDRENAARRANARRLRELLRGIPGLAMAEEPPGSEPVYHLLSFTIEPEACPFGKDAALARLREQGLPLFPYIPLPIHRMKRLNPRGYDGPPVLWHRWLAEAGVDYARVQCPEAERRCARALEMPWNFTGEDPEAMRAIATAFRAALQG